MSVRSCVCLTYLISDTMHWTGMGLLGMLLIVLQNEIISSLLSLTFNHQEYTKFDIIISCFYN